MKLLLDTHALLWWLADDAALGKTARAPKCHTAQTQEWLGHRQAEMLPVPRPAMPFVQAGFISRDGATGFVRRPDAGISANRSGPARTLRTGTRGGRTATAGTEQAP